MSDEMLDAYRQASASEAGRPSPATREAILAEARAAAAARAATGRSPPEPATTGPWFSWRLAASLAVIGIGLIVWRNLPRETTQVLEAPPATVAMKVPVEPAPVESAPARGAPAASEDAAAERRGALASPRSNFTDKPLPAPAPQPVIVDLNVKQAVPESEAAGARAERAAPAAASAALRRAEPRPDFDALVRRDFPALAEQARPPVGVWLLLDASGRALRTGTLERGQTLGSVLTSLQRELPDRRLRAFETGIVRTAGGATVLVGVARAE